MHLFAFMPVFRQFAGSLLWACLPLALMAQPKDLRFGYVSEADVHMTTYDPYPEADAVMLADVGEAKIAFSSQNQAITRYKFTQRIKILTEAGQSQGDFVIPYEHGDNMEVFTGLKAQTYLPLPGGGVEEIKLKKQDIFEEVVNDRITLVKFSMPQAQPGAVLEVTYNITRKSMRPLKAWTFQLDIPVVYSEYRTHIPEWFKFVPLVWGQSAKHESSSYRQRVVLNASSEFEARRSQSVNVHFVETVYRMENLLPLIEEPYLTNLDDYRAKIEFQLSTITWPNQSPKRVLTSWEELTTDLIASSRFGKVIDGHRAIRRWYQELDVADLSETEKAHRIYQIVNQRLRWNGGNAFVAEENPQDVLDAGEGDSGDLNLILVGLMREAGLNAYPVLISTRAHGKPIPMYPLMRQFNSVLALVQVGEVWVPLDATDPDLPFGMLPKRALNHQGFLVMSTNPQWINLSSNFIDSRKARVMMRLNEEGKIWGDYRLEYKDYQGISARKAWRQVEKKAETFTRDYALNGGLSEATLEDLKIEEGSLTTPFVVNTKLEARQYVSVANNFIYLQPMLNEALAKNPFQLEARSYPVDFATPLHLDFMANFFIPEGYVVESLPEPIQVALPNRGAVFSYQVVVNAGLIQLVSKVQIDQTVFEPEEYPAIREFFERVVAKHAEQVVLKKTS